MLLNPRAPNLYSSAFSTMKSKNFIIHSELDTFEVEYLFILFEKRILWFSKNCAQRGFVERI
jgi:hypothetical protein